MPGMRRMRCRIASNSVRLLAATSAMKSHLPLVKGGHFRIAAEYGGDPLAGAALDFDQHDPPDRRMEGVGPENDGVADDIARLLQFLDPRPYGGTRQTGLLREIGDRTAAVLSQKRHQPVVCFIHRGSIRLFDFSL